jgi:protein-L-isoaspartate(D-aspartate) O-methyltransferase
MSCDLVRAKLHLGVEAMLKRMLLSALALAALRGEATAVEAECAHERAAMVNSIQTYASSMGLGARGFSERLLDALAQTPRHRFVRERSCAIAYADRPVPIGQGQTMSQPLIVALMTELAAVGPEHTVLEIGTGSGYQAAILARLARQVCTIEIVAALAETAATVLRELGHDNVRRKIGDGYEGWPECGPYDAILVTAALDHEPPLLIEQLKIGGRLVMPLGMTYATQQLTVFEKTAPGQTRTRSVIPVRFVPFTRPRH